jgi:hypothetical protein
MINSLKASIPFIADILLVNPHTLYERQRALVGEGLLESKPGRGPGSGTRFTPETAAVLLISMLATDSLKDSGVATRALSDAKLTSVPIGQEDELGSPQTFKAAIANALSSDAVVNKITFLRVHRRSFMAEIFTADQSWKEPPAGKIFSRAERLLDHENDRLHSFEPKKKHADTYEGMVVVVELRGGAAVGKGGRNPTLGKIRALIRNEEIAAAANESPAVAKAPAKKRSALKKG